MTREEGVRVECFFSGSVMCRERLEENVEGREIKIFYQMAVFILEVTSHPPALHIYKNIGNAWVFFFNSFKDFKKSVIMLLEISY